MVSTSRPMRIRVSRSAWLLVSSAATLFGVAAFTNSVWPQLLGCVVVGLLVTSLLAVARPLRIKVTTRMPDRVTVGRPFESAIILRNVSRRTGGALVVRHSWPTSRTLVAAHATFVGRIDARGEVVVAMTRTPAARGVLSADEVRIDATAPFGLFSRTTVELVDRELLVLPAPATTETIPASAGGYGATARRKGTDVGGVREWRSGDQVRHVQWRSAARTGRLTVAERDHVAPGSMVLLIAGRSGDPALEDAIAKAATVCTVALRRGAPVFIAGDGGGCVRVRTQASLLELLARAEVREPLDEAALNRAVRCAVDGGSVLVAAGRAVSGAWAPAVQRAAALAGVTVVDLASVASGAAARGRA